MEKEFIPYEQALALKELGFDEPCFGYWNIDPYLPNPTFNMVRPFDHEWCLPAPLKQQSFSWFREKYGLPSHIATYWQHDWNNYSYQYYFVQDKVEWNGIEHYKTYEEAELECLKKLIEIVKRNNIMKEEPKYPIGGYAPGYYGCTCVTCKTEFMGDKRAVQCEPCAISMTKEEPKKETLEEITEQIQNECHSFIESVPNVNYQDATNVFIFMKLAELTLKLKNYEK